jgi:hypothetical protein
MQYRLFSSNKQYLPSEPKDLVLSEEIDIENNLMLAEVNQVSVPNSLSLVNGDETLLNYLGTPKNVTMNTFRTPNPTLLMSDIGAVIDDFIDLANLSIVEADERMSTEAEGIFLKKKEKEAMQKINIYQSKVLKEMQATNTRSNGYIVWLLSPTEAELSTIFDLKPEPFDPSIFITKKNQDIVIEEDEEILQETATDLNVNTVLNNKTKDALLKQKNNKKKATNEKVAKSVKKMINGSKEMISASNAMLNKIASGQVFMSSEFCYDMTGITDIERKYYEDRSSLEKIISLKAELYQQAYEIPWSPLPLPVLSAADVQRIEDDRKEFAEKAARATAIGKKVMMKKGHDIGEDKEIVGRDFEEEKKKKTAKKGDAKADASKKQKRQKKLDDLSNSILSNSDAINAIEGIILKYFIYF